MMKMELKYIELKTGYNDNGPAWIGLAQKSKSGQTLYFNNKALLKANGISGNYLDIETGEEYWISTPKKNGMDRHPVGTGSIIIQETALETYLKYRNLSTLPKDFHVEPIPETSIKRFHTFQNSKID